MATSEKTSSKPARVREKVVEAPKPELRSDTETMKTYAALLDAAPKAPTFMNMFEVTAWLDSKYNKWLSQVKHELGK